MTRKLASIVLSVALMGFLMTTTGCDERDWARSHHDGDGSWTDVYLGFDIFPSYSDTYVTEYDTSYYEETTVTTDYTDYSDYSGYDEYYYDGGDWKGKRPG